MLEKDIDRVFFSGEELQARGITRARTRSLWAC